MELKHSSKNRQKILNPVVATQIAALHQYPLHAQNQKLGEMTFVHAATVVNLKSVVDSFYSNALNSSHDYTTQ